MGVRPIGSKKPKGSAVTPDIFSATARPPGLPSQGRAWESDQAVLVGLMVHVNGYGGWLGADQARRREAVRSRGTMHGRGGGVRHGGATGQKQRAHAARGVGACVRRRT